MRTSIPVAALVDTNILIYIFDPADQRKQRIAGELLERGLRENSIRIPHQAILEFVAVTTRPKGHGHNAKPPLLTLSAARREAEEFLGLFQILYPDELIVRMALRGAAAYQLSWYDAHMWAYAECNGMGELLSEDFTHQRRYGSVLAVNPLLP